MNAEQKRAWLAVGSGVGIIISFAVLAAFFGLMVGTMAFAFFALNAFGGLIGRGEKSDERDKSILRRAAIGGFGASYMTFILVLMGVWWTCMLQKQTQISIHVLPQIVALGFITGWLARAVAILVMYGRHTEADHA